MADTRGSGANFPTNDTTSPLLRAQSDVHEQDLEATEVTPLISRPSQDTHTASGSRRSSAVSLLKSIQGETKPRRRWPSLIALVLLCIVAILIMVLGFFAPEVMEEYAMQAATFEPTSLSIKEFTSTGVRARVQGDFNMDSSKVKKGSVRNFGRFGTWFAAKVESGASSVQVSLPEYGNIHLGTADIPPLVVDVRNGHTTHIDFVANITPGDFDGVRKIARDWIDGRLGQLRIFGEAQVPVKSGIFSFGKQTVSHSIVFQSSDIPTMPKYSIKKLDFSDVDLPDSKKALAADVVVTVGNDYPVDVEVPPLGFEVLVENCSPKEPRIPLAYVSTPSLHVTPHEDVTAKLLGIIHELPADFLEDCPNKEGSPLDILLSNYINGKDATVFVRGSSTPSGDVPQWITDMISDIIVPISVPGHALGQLIESFSLNDVHFGLPDPLADEDSPEANPTISAVIKALITLPEQMNFNISVQHVRADADVFYKGSKLGKLDLKKWQQANSTKVESKNGNSQPRLLVQSKIEEAPLHVTDNDVLADVVEALLFGGSKVVLAIKAEVDVQIETALGKLTVRRVPAEGKVPVKPIGNGTDIGTVKPQVGQLQIIDTSETSLTIFALVNFTNPTEYSASIPYADVHILNNGSVLGHGTIQTVHLKPGKNHNIPVTVVWDPLTAGGETSRKVGVELLSQYISGFNTTITVRTHEGSIPSQPGLGRALSGFSVEIPTPRLLDPPESHDPKDPNKGKDPKDSAPHFISDATMHLLSSTATFTLVSPLRSSTIYITYINATALYKGDKVGHIDFDDPFEVPPIVPTITPPLPVDWSLGSVGYEAIRNAVGGSLRLAAKATVGVKIGLWEERVWYVGQGIGAKIRL
ncbi:hypothetical protein K461DRAFT_320758 [Myriangium duriaei CBS 260.36]|uniref:Pre-rRNA processing protein n=1 Tax=Myriangium duriaei CBS 260.36 TaxID=1168546 RepID=A0A9P4J037_9PEZI|nr:hypothetical protein K461DRAFT_320758 [Myriangium duriaei CBS 260.36]